MTFRRLEHIVGLGIALCAFALYIFTLCPTVNFIDSGELAADAYTLGVAHPTGYPLFTLTGYLFAHAPLGFRVIYQLNLMAAIFCAAALYVYFRFMLFFINDLFLKDNRNAVRPHEIVTAQTVLTRVIPATFGTLVLAFSETYWSQALSIEVYSLHVLFLALLLMLFTKALHTDVLQRKERHEIERKNYYWFFFAYVLGLSFTNHGTTILLAPAFLAAYFSVNDMTSRSAWKKLLQLSVPFILGLSVILYLPIRASVNPILNWGDPDTLENLLWHLQGKQYSVWLFESWETAGKQFKYFVNTFPKNFAYLPIGISVLGAWKLFKVNKSLFVFTILLFVVCVGYSINYDIHDIDSYFLLAYATIAIWCTAGVHSILSFKWEKNTVVSIVGVLFIVLLFMPFSNFNDVNENNSFLVEDYTRDMFNSLQENGIIISYQWDYFVSAAYYFQLVEKQRPDIVIIDKELLRRSWYLEQLEHRYPWLIQQSRIELDGYQKELHKFERNLPYNANVIEFHYSNFIRSIIEKNYQTRTIYVTQEIEPRYTGKYERIPSGLAFQLVAGKEYHQIVVPDFSFRMPSRKDKYVDGIQSLYARSYYNRAVYAIKFGAMKDAYSYNTKSLNIYPDFPEARILSQNFQQK